MNLLGLSLRNAAANRSRFTLTALAVLLSVAFLTAALILTESISGTAESDIASANAGVDFVVEGATIVEGDGAPGEAADRLSVSLPPDLVEDAMQISGVSDAAGEVIGFAKLVSRGKAIGEGTAMDEGRNWLGDSGLNPYRIVDGVAPTGPSEVALTRRLASDGDVAVGDAVQVLTPNGMFDATVSALVTYGPADATPLARTILFAPDAASSVLSQPMLQRIRVETDSNVDPVATRAALQSLADDLVVLDGDEYIAARQAAVTSPFEFLSIFLLAFAAIATVAGITIILNTLVIAIGQRRRELALLRAVGAQRKQVLRSVLLEAASVAVVATALGLVLGWLSAGALRRVMDVAGLSFLDGPLITSATTIAIAGIVGIGVSVAAAWGPARAAAAAAPVEALREAAAEKVEVTVRRTATGLFLLAVGVLTAIAAAVLKNALLLAGLAVLVPGLILAGPAIVAAFANRVQPLLSRLAGITGAMAATNLARNPRRSASTSLGLTLGVALILFFATLASSISASFGDSLDRSLNADLVATSATPDFPTIDPGLEGRINDVPGATAVALALAEGSIDGESATVGGIDPGFPELFDLFVASGSLEGLANDGVAVWSGNEGAVPQVGETVRMTLQDSTVEVPVVAIFDESLAGFESPTHLVSAELFAELDGGSPDFVVFVSAQDEATRESVRAAIADTPGALFETRASYLANAGAEADALLNLIYALLGLTVAIAILGVANTTALSISERVREIGMLRAVGASRQGVRRMVRWEAGTLAIVGSIAGVVIAIGGAWAFLRAAGGTSLATFDVPWFTVGVVGIGAVAASVLAASLPAWRAAKYPTLQAIASS